MKTFNLDIENLKNLSSSTIGHSGLVIPPLLGRGEGGSASLDSVGRMRQRRDSDTVPGVGS